MGIVNLREEEKDEGEKFGQIWSNLVRFFLAKISSWNYHKDGVEVDLKKDQIAQNAELDV